MVRRSRISEEIKLENGKDKASKIKYPSISYFTLYRFATRCDKGLISIAVIASFVAAASLPYAITLVASTFNNMILYAKIEDPTKEDDETFLGQMNSFGILYSCVGVLIFVGGYLGSALMNVTAINQVYKIREAYLRSVLNQDFAYFDLYQTGDFASKMADDIIKLEEGIGDKVSAVVYNLTITVSCVSMALYKGWKLALMCLTTAPVTFILVGLTGKLANRLSKKEAECCGRASSIAQEVLGSIRTVYSFNGQQKELRRYMEPLAEARKIKIKKEFFTGLSMASMFLCIFSSYAVSFYWGIYLVINDPNNYNADVMFSVFFGVMTGMGTLGVVGSLVGAFGVAKGAGAQIFYLIDNVPTINPLLDRGIKPKVEGNIELRNVFFKYPARLTVPVLNGLSVKVSHGQSIALVGHSGCGKSTIISLVSRYYDVLDGSVHVDGHDVRELSVSWLRAHIGLVSQEPTLFNTTIRENIRYGRDEASNDDVQAAAKTANAHDFIVKLPKGYDTLVGERGASLSGGQKQRIAIARALVRNPRILLLDEATSALDMTSEAKVQQALEKAAEGRTTIIVAHRLSTIRNVDMIYVMKNGNVIETGTHEQLMRIRGHYYDMVITQEPNILDGLKGEDAKAPDKIASVIEEDEETSDTISVIEKSGEEKVQKLSFWSIIRLNSPEWKSITVGCIGSICIGFALPLFIVVFGDMFGAMSDSDKNKLMQKGRSVANTCVVIGFVMGVSNLIECISFGVAGAYLTERLRVRMFAHMLQQHVGYFDQRGNSTGALCARLSAEAAYVQGATGQRIGIALQGLGSIGLAIVLAMLFQWKVGLVAISFFPVIALVIYYQAKQTGKESQGNAVALENSTKVAMEAVSNIRAVAALGREKRFLAEYTAQLRPTLPLSHRSAHCRGIINGMSRSMFNFINAAALTYGGHLIVQESISYDHILVTTQSLQMASGQLQNAFTFAPDFQKGINAGSRIVGSLKQKTKISDPPVPVQGFVSKGNASLTNVEFRYPSRPEQKILRGLNLQVESGKTVALVGSSGCGKSTVIQLLQRFYDPDSGVVYLEEYPIPTIRVSEVRSSFGLVSQEPTLFALSVRDNIAYGDNSRDPSMVEVIQAAKMANIHDFIVSLPEGYETNIGSKGVQLSGGQKQRVAIARALIRNPKILLLDEATSALDIESEQAVLQALDVARSGRTCIVIAHRLTTVRDADIIHVVDGGRTVEAGTHQQLLHDNGVYAKLYHAAT